MMKIYPGAIGFTSGFSQEHKYLPQFENQGINPVRDNAQVTEYLHKQSTTCTQHDKGVVNPFTVICKVRSDRDG